MLESSELESELAVRGLVLSAFFSGISLGSVCLAVADLGDRRNALQTACLPFQNVA